MRQRTAQNLLTPREVANALGVSPVTIRNWVAKGWLKSRVTPGGHRRFLWQDVELLLKDKPRSCVMKSLRILVADADSECRAHLVTAILSLLPEAAIVEAADGFHAGLNMAELQPDMVFIDFALPGINGSNTCRSIRLKPQYRQVQLVMLVDKAHRHLDLDTGNAGIDYVQNKPVALDMLRQILGKAARGHHGVGNDDHAN
jgi:excisionase family DNA binding protein